MIPKFLISALFGGLVLVSGYFLFIDVEDSGYGRESGLSLSLIHI